MNNSRQRLLFFVTVLSLCFLSLEVRLFHLQVIKNAEAVETADGMHHQFEKQVASRGRILARNEYVLAESIPAVEVYANHVWTRGHRDQLATELAASLGADRAEIRDELDLEGYRKLLRKHLGRKPLCDGAQIAELRQKKRDRSLPGLELEQTWVRSYPEGRLAANVVGYTDLEGRGRAGIELAFDRALGGERGETLLGRDARGRPIFDLGCRMQRASPGCDVHLTLDMVIQYYSEEALDQIMAEHQPEWASIVVLDPLSGDVLAMACRPTFDPTHYGNFDQKTHVNRAVTYQYTPGSTFKPFFMAAAIDTLAVSLSEFIDCSSFRIGRRVVRDSHPSGDLTPYGIITESSNIGMSKIALRMAPDDTFPKATQVAAFRRIRAILTDLGFGRQTGIELEAETCGTLPAASNWTRAYTLVSLSFGHEIAVSPLQLAAAYTVFANEGMYLQPRLVARVVEPDGAELPQPPRARHQVFRPATAARVREMMVGVVDEGTGTSACLEAYSVAGKTSTAQWESDPNKYTSSFVGFAPAGVPRLLVAVVVDQPGGQFHSGGRVAAPAAREILERGLTYLRVEPDRPAGSLR